MLPSRVQIDPTSDALSFKDGKLQACHKDRNFAAALRRRRHVLVGYRKKIAIRSCTLFFSKFNAIWKKHILDTAIVFVLWPYGALNAQSSTPSLVVAPTTGINASGPRAGPFSPATYKFHVRATAGSVRYSVSTPSWLRAAPEVGEADVQGVTVTITINPTTHRLPPGVYGPAVAFANLTNGRGTTTRAARLTVRSPTLLHRGEQAISNQTREYLIDDTGGQILGEDGLPLLAK